MVKALVEATPISGPARVKKRSLDNLTKALSGTLQIASFHPQFQFDQTDAHDISNATNRAPYPMLHLLRESSIDRAVKAFPQADAIFEANIQTMQRLGASGWAELAQTWTK